MSDLPRHFSAQFSLLFHVCLLLIYRNDLSLSCCTNFSLNKPTALFSSEFEQRLPKSNMTA